MNKELLEKFISHMNFRHFEKSNYNNGYLLKDKNNDEMFIYSTKKNIVVAEFNNIKRTFCYNKTFNKWIIVN